MLVSRNGCLLSPGLWTVQVSAKSSLTQGPPIPACFQLNSLLLGAQRSSIPHGAGKGRNLRGAIYVLHFISAVSSLYYFDAFAENCDFWPLWCQREGTAPPPTSISHLPPPSRLLLEELYGWVWSTPPSSLPPSPSPIPHSPPFSLLSHPLPLPILLLLLQSPSLLLPAPFSLSPPLGDASLWLESWKVTQGSAKRKGILLYLKILSPDKLLQLCFCI